MSAPYIVVAVLLGLMSLVMLILAIDSGEDDGSFTIVIVPFLLWMSPVIWRYFILGWWHLWFAS